MKEERMGEKKCYSTFKRACLPLHAKTVAPKPPLIHGPESKTLFITGVPNSVLATDDLFRGFVWPITGILEEIF
jgi:hypothetical protein